VNAPARKARRRPGGPGRAARAVPLEQLPLDFAAPPARWTFSRRILATRHQKRILERLEFVRRFFPELDELTIHVGQALKRGVLGWGSLDPERPGIWVRPIRIAHFTIAHEYTHLLQARGLVPHGERACDLWALARSPLIIDSMPGYLRVPRSMRTRGDVDPATASLLHRLACESIARRDNGDRRYLAHFERELTDVVRGPRLGRRPAPVFTAHPMLPFDS
jgi:hypothetical protein